MVSVKRAAGFTPAVQPDRRGKPGGSPTTHHSPLTTHHRLDVDLNPSRIALFADDLLVQLHAVDFADLGFDGVEVGRLAGGFGPSP